jgi:beta-galactosidase
VGKKEKQKRLSPRFSSLAQKRSEEMIKRDRNHPSIILWSIGNEIREQFDSTGISLTKELVAIVKNLDKTRPIISALNRNKSRKEFYLSGQCIRYLWIKLQP